MATSGLRSEGPRAKDAQLPCAMILCPGGAWLSWHEHDGALFSSVRGITSRDRDRRHFQHPADPPTSVWPTKQ